jgi:hypothetical protein
MSGAPAGDKDKTPMSAAALADQKLAESIYVELLGRAFLRVENAAVIKPEAGDLARLSLKLAIAFRDAEKAIAAELGPKNVGYDIKGADWIK